MILSMTGYANASVELASGVLSLDLRAVNHRYLDLQLRMPDELRCFEGALREQLTGQLSRGKVECRINWLSRRTGQSLVLSQAVLLQLAEQSRQIQAVFPEARALSVAELLAWPGVLETAELSADELKSALLTLLQQVLSEFNAFRAREGEKLKAFLLERVSGIEHWRQQLKPRIPAAVKAYEQRLLLRLQEALSQPDHERLCQEVALFASRIDVDEELSRLASHLSEIERVLSQGGAVGKRLDFLMQELNREANTLASKAVDQEVSRGAIEVKVLIEQMREQVQNLE